MSRSQKMFEMFRQGPNAPMFCFLTRLLSNIDKNFRSGKLTRKSKVGCSHFLMIFFVDCNMVSPLKDRRIFRLVNLQWIYLGQWIFQITRITVRSSPNIST